MLGNDDVGNSTTAATADAVSTLEPTSFDTVSYYIPDSTRFDQMFVHQIIIQKVVGLLSAIGSAYIMYSLVIDVKDAAHRRKKLHRTFERLLLLLCVADLISSIAFFLASW